MNEENTHEIEELLVPVEPDKPVPWGLFAVTFAALVLLVFILQNFEQVKVEFLTLEFNMPLAIVIILTVIISATLALSVSAFRRRRKKKRAAKSVGAS